MYYLSIGNVSYDVSSACLPLTELVRSIPVSPDNHGEPFLLLPLDRSMDEDPPYSDQVTLINRVIESLNNNNNRVSVSPPPHHHHRLDYRFLNDSLTAISHWAAHNDLQLSGSGAVVITSL